MAKTKTKTRIHSRFKYHLESILSPDYSSGH